MNPSSSPKKRKLDHSNQSNNRSNERPPLPPPPSSSSTTNNTATTTSTTIPSLDLLTRLPPETLLLTLPNLFRHAANRKLHVYCHFLALSALRKCLSSDGLAPDVECRACTALAEIGIKIIESGWTKPGGEEFKWAQGVEHEVEKAIGKGLLLAKSTPSIAIHHHVLTLLHARLASWQGNARFCRSLLKRLISTLSSSSSSSAPSWLIYTAHLTSISSSLQTSPPDLSHVFSTLQDLQDVSTKLKDAHVMLLSHVLRLRILANAGMWESVEQALSLAESSLGLSYAETPENTMPPPGQAEDPTVQNNYVTFDDPFEAAMAIHVLVLGVVYYTHISMSKQSSPRLSHLHALIDSGTLDGFPDGTVFIRLSIGPPLAIKCTHPRIVLHLTYLVSALSKRDAVGRKPKRKVFASEGMAVLEREASRGFLLPSWSTSTDVDEITDRLVKIHADTLCELVSVCTMRNEFSEAEHHLEGLIAHTRTHELFPSYAARISLFYAYMAHAKGEVERALKCYRVAALHAPEGSFLNVAAKMGSVGLRIGLGSIGGGEANGKMNGKTNGSGTNGQGTATLAEEVQSLAKAAKGMGGALESASQILQACVSEEIMTAKSHLKTALDLASRAQDNHLRALCLALISPLYMNTAGDHARKMLETCGQLAVGLGGAPSYRDKDKPPQQQQAEGGEGENRDGGEKPMIPSLGNAPLSLWVGKRFLELYRRDGDERNARRQEYKNGKLEEAMRGAGYNVP